MAKAELEKVITDLGLVLSYEFKDTYNACLKIALALRNGLGDEGLKRLQEAAQDY